MIFPGKIRIELPKDKYYSDEAIEGAVVLDLDKEVKARGVRIIFTGQESGKKAITIQRDELRLDDATVYEPGTKKYQFRFTITQIQRFDTESLGFLKGLGDLIIGDTYETGHWWLDASLDIPNALDVNATKRIYLKRAESQNK